MTPHPIDTEEARFGAEAHLRYGGGGDDLAENVLALLDVLAAAEHRATRAEAQSEARRINAEYWKEEAVTRGISFREARAERDQNLEDLGKAEARIKAVEELHDGVTAHDECEHCRQHTPCPTIRALA